MNELEPSTRVWKVGSRWSYDGNPDSCILEIFRKHHVVFVGREHDKFIQIGEGDLIAVSSGKRVVALGRAQEAPKSFLDFGITFSEEESEQVHPHYIGLACRINFQDLRPEDYVSYIMGAFHAVRERADQFRNLYQSYQEAKESDEFSIKARSRTLLRNATSPEDVLLSPQQNYHIPIFQRAYSWGEPEVRRLLHDLLNAFEGRLGRAKREPLFIGTMQVSAPKVLDEIKGVYRHDIIDGQQRMTTMALLLRAIQLSQGLGSEARAMLLTTAIGGGTQQDYLDKALTTVSPEVEGDVQNRYLENLKLIIAHLRDDEALETADDFAAFYDFVTSRVFFVVIETRAGLSKTLQIFDSINTSGMDLNGGDVFKIRYYEYLREKEGHCEGIFDSIAHLYNIVDERNKGFGEEKLRMEGILDYAKWAVCAQLNLPYGPREMRGTTFFDRLFDSALLIEQWDGFAADKLTNLKLPIGLFEDTIEAATSWHTLSAQLSPEAMVMNQFIWWGRYWNYHNPLVINFIRRFQPELPELEIFLVRLGKLLFIYSIRSQKKTYSGRGVMHDVLLTICNQETTVVSLLSFIAEKCREQEKAVSNTLLTDWIAGIPKSKNLLCRLVAYLEQRSEGDPTGEDLCHLLFWGQEIDIEHIEAANHKDGTIRADIKAEWGQDLHGLGNLTVLERDINRSIRNELYSSHKRARYQTSKFNCVKTFANEYPEWTLELAKKRKERLAEELTNYLCSQ